MDLPVLFGRLVLLIFDVFKWYEVNVVDGGVDDWWGEGRKWILRGYAQPPNPSP